MSTEEEPQCAECEGGKAEGAVLRCACGSLLARYVGGQVELKCRRCKRAVMIPITHGESSKAST